MDFKWKQQSPGHYVPYRKWEQQELTEKGKIDWAAVYAVAVVILMFSLIGIVLGGGYVP